MWAGSVDADGYPTWNTYKERQPTDDELRLWFALSGQRNLGIVTGFDNLTVIDFDSFDAWDAWSKLAGDCDLLARHSYRVWTARGVHVYLRTQEPVASYSVGQIDIKARWGYVLGEGSVHPTGAAYRGNGGMIPTLPDMTGLFGLERPVQSPSSDCEPRVQYDDPWDSADHATGPIAMGAIEAIKLRFTPADILGLGATRGRVTIKCPLHHDTSPSFVIYPDGHWRCFGCGAYGDALDLYAALHNVPLADAVAALEGQL
jgi:hypothetical protein